MIRLFKGRAMKYRAAQTDDAETRQQTRFSLGKSTSRHRSATEIDPAKNPETAKSRKKFERMLTRVLPPRKLRRQKKMMDKAL
jgi:hypothetical protein